MNVDLKSLLKSACTFGAHPTQIWDQRVEFVYARMREIRPDTSREDVVDAATKMYGPRPS